MKILKIFLILSSLYLFLNADDYKSKHKYKHSYKNLEYLDLNKEQIKEIKDVLIEFKYKYKEFYEYEQKQEDILKDITKNDNFDEKLYLDTLLDLKTKASKLQVQKMKEIGCAGTIIGKAIYEGRISLEDLRLTISDF